MGTIMIVEDNTAIADKLEYMLRLKQHEVYKYYDYLSAQQHFLEFTGLEKNPKHFDLVVCDLNINPEGKKAVPKETLGFELLRFIHVKSPDTYRVIYTAYPPELVAAKCVGLGEKFFQKTTKSGFLADNKATTDELAGYINSRFLKDTTPRISTVYGVTVDHNLETVMIGGRYITMSILERRMLAFLIQNPEQYFEPRALFTEIYPEYKTVEDLSEIVKKLDELTERINKKLGKKLVVAARFYTGEAAYKFGKV